MGSRRIRRRIPRSPSRWNRSPRRCRCSRSYREGTRTSTVPSCTWCRTGMHSRTSRSWRCRCPSQRKRNHRRRMDTPSGSKRTWARMTHLRKHVENRTRSRSFRSSDCRSWCSRSTRQRHHRRKKTATWRTSKSIARRRTQGTVGIACRTHHNSCCRCPSARNRHHRCRARRASGPWHTLMYTRLLGKPARSGTSHRTRRSCHGRRSYPHRPDHTGACRRRSSWRSCPRSRRCRSDMRCRTRRNSRDPRRGRRIPRGRSPRPARRSPRPPRSARRKRGERRSPAPATPLLQHSASPHRNPRPRSFDCTTRLVFCGRVLRRYAQNRNGKLPTFPDHLEWLEVRRR